MNGSIQIFGKTAAQWAADLVTIPLDRQLLLETDTLKHKWGNGVDIYNNLLYPSGGAAAAAWGAITGLLSDQTDLQDELDAKADKTSQLLTGGIISIGSYGGAGVNNDIRITASTFFIVGFGNHSAVQTDFLDIALSSAGNQRYIGLYGTTLDTITKVEGAEAALATFPATPANTALIGYVLVGDANIGTTPDLSGYLLKSDKATSAEIVTGTEDAKYLTPLGLKGAKDTSGGYTGLTLLKINFKNALNTFTSFFTNSNTAARTYTFPDRSMTAAGTDDIGTIRMSGKYFGACGITPATGLGWLGRVYTLPFFIEKRGSFDAIRVEITGAVASENIRMALYDDSGGGYPNNLLEDSGNISAATTGEKSYVFSSARTLNPGIYYFAFQASHNSIAIRYWSQLFCILPRPSGGTSFGSYSYAYVYNVFQNPFPVGATEQTLTFSAPMMGIKMA